MEMQKYWAELSKHHELPEFNKFDSDFDIGGIDDDPNSKTIIVKIYDKVEFYIGLLSELLQPDASNIYSLHETRFFDDNEKKEIYKLYCRLMGYHRKCIELTLKNSEKENIEFISSIFKEWQEIKQNLIGVITKMKDSWSKEIDMEERLEYLG